MLTHFDSTQTTYITNMAMHEHLYHLIFPFLDESLLVPKVSLITAKKFLNTSASPSTCILFPTAHLQEYYPSWFVLLKLLWISDTIIRVTQRSSHSSINKNPKCSKRVFHNNTFSWEKQMVAVRIFILSLSWKTHTLTRVKSLEDLTCGRRELGL